MREVTIQEFFRIYAKTHRVYDHLFDDMGDSPAPSELAPSEPQPTPTCLQVLGLTLPCTQDDIHRAFRTRVMSAHPDRGGSDEAFRQLYEAYREALTTYR